MEAKDDDAVETTYIVEKREVPHLWLKRPSDIHISRRQNLQAIRRRLQEILTREDRVHLHAMGAAIPRALEVCARTHTGRYTHTHIHTHIHTHTQTGTHHVL